MDEIANSISIGEKIKTKRKNFDMTQSQLSDVLGISRQTLSKWENDKTFPDVEKLMMLCDIFDSTPDEFLNDYSDSKIQIIRYMRKRLVVQRKFIKLLIAILLILLISGGSYHYGKSRQDEKEFESKETTVKTDMLPLYRTLKYKVAYIGGVCMSRGKMKLSSEERLALAERALRNEASISSLAKEAQVDSSTIERWITLYENEGPTGLLPTKRNQSYSTELKLNAVHDYLAGTYGSLRAVAKKYGLRNKKQLEDWLKIYNTHRNFKSESGGSRMSKSRKTTLNERVKIVHDCIINGRDYGKTAIQYHVSYQQVRNWVLKYDEMGEKGLEDRRGQRAGSKPARTPEEEMRDKLAQQERRIKLLEMENDLLKKVSELERRRDLN
ncbi:helix-turn-helix domain-containing protein [Enterococcus avium]|nr:helix-turn-helix domain-containing protein [Enterococcus avium]